MANRFDTPYGQRYVSQYVPLPFEAIGALGEQIQKKKDSLLETVEKAKKLTYVKSDPLNQKHAEQLQTEYNNTLTELSNKVLQEGYTPQTQMAINNTVNSIVNDPRRITIENAKANYDKFVTDRDKLSLDGKWDQNTYEDYFTKNRVAESENGVIGYTYKGVRPKMDWGARMQELGKNLKADESLKKLYQRDASGNFVVKDGMVNRIGKGWEGITESKLWSTAKNLVDPFYGSLEANYYIDSKAGGRYKNYNEMSTTPEDRFSYEQVVTKKDAKGKKYQTKEKVQRSEKDYFRDEAMKDIFKANSPLLFTNSISEEDLHNLSAEAYKDKKDKENYEYRDVYENPANADAIKNTYTTGLAKVGISTAGLVNSDGTYKNNMYESGYTKPVVDKATGKRYLAYTETPALKDHYTEIYNTANRLGMPIPKLKGQGKNGADIIDFKTLEQQLAAYGNNLETTGSTTQGFQTRFSNNITNHVLGETTIDTDGKETTKMSHILETAKVTRMDNGVNEDNKEALVRTGRLTGLNFHAKNAGTLRLDANNQAYDIYTGNKTLAAITKNTHALTKATDEASVGNRTPDTKIQVFDIGGKTVTTTIQNYADTKITGIIEFYNQSGATSLLENFKEQIKSLSNARPIDVQQFSDVTYIDKNGNKRPKYEHITYQSIDPNTSVPVYNIVQIDYEHGGIPSVVDLNTIHKETTDYVESKMAHNYEPTNK